jgi:hypothetical protein
MQLAGISQESKISISGNFVDEPFLAFTKAIESKYNLNFFFYTDDVKHLKVNGNYC